jgi:hypothetical protein
VAVVRLALGSAARIAGAPPAGLPGLGAARFERLWRGSRDGFGAASFHARCDGRPSTVTLVEDTEGNVFGAFTPVAWDSRAAHAGTKRPDPSGRSFIFTLRNPSGAAPEALRLKPGADVSAIDCDGDYGPCFGGGCDLSIVDECNRKTDNYCGRLGKSYECESGRIPAAKLPKLLAGHHCFRVKEIEVFQVLE